MSTGSPGAIAAISVPAQNSDIASMNTGRVLIRWIRKPVIGMTTAMVSRNAVVNHCAALADAFRLAISCGRATAMTVSLRITTKADTSIR